MAVEHGLETGRLPLVGVFDGMRWKIQDKEAGGDKYGKIGKLNLDLVQSVINDMKNKTRQMSLLQRS